MGEDIKYYQTKAYQEALYEVSQYSFCDHEYSLSGPKENAVCIEKLDGIDKWLVYKYKDLAKRNVNVYDQYQKAALDFLKRLSPSVDLFIEYRTRFLSAFVNHTNIENIR